MNNINEALEAGGLAIDHTEHTDNEALHSDVAQKSDTIKKELDTMTNVNSLVFSFEDIDGEPISPREENGTYFVDMIEIEKIAFNGSKETQIRQEDLNIFELQQSIEKLDIIEPIHVVPFGRPVLSDTGLPKFAKYLILSGQRRFEAYRALGRSHILALVNTTINKQLIDVYKGILQNSKPYTFQEKVDYAMRMNKEQRSMSVETLENFLGYRSGEFTKSVYIDQMKVDYPDIYTQVEKGKLSIEQGYKRLEKEIEKAEKALLEGDEMSGDDVEDALRAKQGDDLSQLQMDNHVQELGNRHILDSNIRRAVESRDSGTCQVCGFGQGETDLMGGFNAHHIVPVMYQGADKKENLILLCRNCHGFVHDYETGRFSPDQETYDRLVWIQKAVVLGNMLRKLRTFSIAEIRKADPNTYNLLQKGALSLGKSIVKSGITVGGLEMFNDNPYQTYMDAIEDIDFGGRGKGEMGGLESFNDELEEEKDLPEENHKPRELTHAELVSATKEEIYNKDVAEGRIKVEQEDSTDYDNNQDSDDYVNNEDTETYANESDSEPDVTDYASSQDYEELEQSNYENNPDYSESEDFDYYEEPEENGQGYDTQATLNDLLNSAKIDEEDDEEDINIFDLLEDDTDNQDSSDEFEGLI